ncbi:TonB-dependent receptor domain-containing protein [Komagataeibacter sp. FNDCF1]|uniref:TonB-dependent receptor n=1 Tax=Komagataeibacter sp. FNDCF1 TaxID=2878681 RepID=UPI001E338E48|nr:TonB-dependent receptor plug domain-containing protein [Komagataeibacter sp. FNDCF1]
MKKTRVPSSSGPVALTICFVVFGCAPAWAADVQDSAVTRDPAASRRPATARAASRTPAHAGTEYVDVRSRRQANWVVTPVTSATIADFVPGTTALKALTVLPGVMYNSADPQGVNTWATSFLMHGFNQNQIGMTMDGMPLGDQQWSNSNGLSPASAISSENISRMDVSASAGSEGAASISNLGGTVQFVSRDPSHKAGGTVAQTFGSNAMYHTFVRADSGDLNRSGTRFWVSYMRNDTRKWRGGQDQFMEQVNSKFVQPIGQDSRISAFFDYSNEQMQNYQDYSMNMFNSGNYGIDNLEGTPNGYATAYRLALAANGRPGGAVPAAYGRLSSPYTASYYDGAGMEREYFGGVTADLALTDRVRWNTTFYGHRSYKVGTVTSPLIESTTGAPFVEQATIPDTNRFGVLSSVSYEVAKNAINGGVWFENTRYTQNKNAYDEPLLSDVENGTATPVDGLHLDNRYYRKEYEQIFNTNTFMAYVQDTYHPTSNLAFHFGFRSVLNTTRVSAPANWETYTRTTAIAGGDGLTTAKPFLPHISGQWSFLPGHQLYFDVAENVKVLPVSAYNSGASPFATTQAAYQASRGSIQSETDWNYAVGYRYTSRLISGSVYAYHTDFSNRLQQISTGSPNNPYTVIKNVGAVTMNGVDAGFSVRPVAGLEVASSISYDHATYSDNVAETTSSGVTTYNVKGQQVVAYPRLMYKGQLSYHWHDAQIHADVQYIGRRNLSYTGDEKVPSYWLTNVGVQYDLTHFVNHRTDSSILHRLTLDLNIYNITNAHYISTMGQNGFPMSGDYQSVALGAPRQFFGSIKADF